jgi:glycosyltransferase involved in cell wall biosynthesis
LIDLHGIKIDRGDTRQPVRQAKVISTKNIPQKKSADETWKWLIAKGFLDDNHLEARNYANVEGAWTGQPCFIIGSGPPLREVLDDLGWDFLRGRHTIGINHTIEEWDGFEWFFFLDRRFLDKTTYDIEKFHGKIFAQATTGLKMKGKYVVFHCAARVGERMADGIYDGNLSGLAALNLAIISGANPIYLLGFGMGKGGSRESYHYREDYTAEVKEDHRFRKFQRVLSKFAAFAPYADRIIHVTPGNDIPWFRKMRPAEFGKLMRSRPAVSGKRIAHLSFSAEKAVHAEITRHVLDECAGVHTINDVKKPIPEADLYILEHFLSTDAAARALPDEIRRKTIAIVHTKGCWPVAGFRRVVSITEAWQKVLRAHGIESTLIRGGIDLRPFAGALPDYQARTFGRMTRWSPGKIHPEWNRVCREILDEVQGSKCLFFVDKENEGGRPKLIHSWMTYSDECKINMDKAPFLRRLSVYVHANGSFKETLSLACAEAIASGLPVVYLSEGTGVIEEVVGPGGVRCETIAQVKAETIRLLGDPAACAEIGARGREHAQTWDKDRMVREYDRLFQEVLS